MKANREWKGHDIEQLKDEINEAVYSIILKKKN